MRRLLLVGNDPLFERHLAQATAGLCEVVRTPHRPAAPADGDLVVIDGESGATSGQFHLILHALPPAASLFATNLAVLRARALGEALLVDCTLPASLAPAALDIGITYAAPQAVRDMPRMDRLLLASALARHSESGLRLLPLAADAADAVDQLSPDDLLLLIQRLQGFFGDIVVDTGGLRHAALLRSLAARATHIHLVVTQTIAALHGARALLDLIDADTAIRRRIVLAVDDHDPAILLAPAQMAAALGVDHVVQLPESRAAQANALNAGEPLVLSRPVSAYARAMAAAAGLSPQPGSAPSLLSRLMELVR